jgi:trehalose-6-phosphatase
MSNEFLNHLRKVNTELNADLAAVFKKHGIKMVRLNMRVDALEGKANIEIRREGADAAVADRKMQESAELFKLYASMEGMKAEWLNKSFSANRTSYTIVGFNPRKKKFAVQVRNATDNKVYGMPTEQVTLFMAREEAKGA